MTRRMLRYAVPVDGEVHEFLLSSPGNPVHVDCSRLDQVEFWTEGDTEGDQDERLGLQGDTVRRTFQVFGTGHRLPHQAVWVGTTDRTAEGLVWHLYELLVGGAS